MHEEEIELKGHIIDSMILPRVFDKIMDMDGSFEVLKFDIGKRKTDHSYARILVKGKTRKHLDEILAELQKIGANIPTVNNVELERVKKEGVAPDNFYSTTNHPTSIRYKDRWIEVKYPEMDCVVVVEDNSAVCKPIGDLKRGNLVVVGHKGVRVKPPERPRGHLGVFEFMSSEVSSEKPTRTLTKKVAMAIKGIKRRGGKIAVVVGPAVVHSGASNSLAKMIHGGYVDLLLAGNGMAVHDIEYAIYGTSLGINLKTGEITEHGHRNHLRTINMIREVGSIKDAVKKGIVKKGIMYELVKSEIPFLLSGSIRDDGPLPDVVTDVIEAQRRMRNLLRDIDMVLMFSTMLHSIAVGNLLPSYVKTICVDINPSTVTKLMDRGSAQALGIVTDVGEFIPELVKELT
ncbi:MAG TPA: TIGR00300 family protein [Candidatus Altiarchaeales archaeon]|nr:TIGR00300 family protein [Candidatus Altiarchaeales archaeon]